MTIHKEGYPSIAIATALSIALGLIAHFFIAILVLKILVYGLAIFIFIAILQFFRSPKRNIVPNVDHVISPADGKVVAIEEVEETEYFHAKRRQVSVFMSPLNVHINRHPVGGTVLYAKYHPGKYLVAWHPKSSTENERTTIVTQNEKGQAVLFRQIAGAVARRIVYYCKEGDAVRQGEECGFIKFGSRVDVLLPVDTKLNVKIGDIVKGGESVIARFS